MFRLVLLSLVIPVKMEQYIYICIDIFLLCLSMYVNLDSNPKGSSVGPVLGLLSNDHWFESSQGHWRFTRSLTSKPCGLVEVRHPRLSNIKKKKKKKKLIF